MSTATKQQASIRDGVQTQAAPPQETPILDQVIKATCDKLDALATRYGKALAETEGRISRAMVLADGLERLRSAMDKTVMQRVMRLQGTKLGFRTDRDGKDKDGKDKDTYPESVVRDCLIEALLRGVYPVGNEFNIIAGQCYITREGYERLVREIEGLTDLKIAPGIPVQHNGQTVVRVAANWRLNGIPDQLVDGEGKPGRVFSVRVNEKMGADGIVGKAIRKTLKAIYEQATGSLLTTSDDDLEESGAVGQSAARPALDPNSSRTEQLAQKLGGGPPRLQPEQIAHLELLLAETKSNAPAFLACLGVGSLEELPPARYREALSILEEGRQGDEAEE